jgi:hypothetical protein
LPYKFNCVYRKIYIRYSSNVISSKNFR